MTNLARTAWRGVGHGGECATAMGGTTGAMGIAGSRQSATDTTATTGGSRQPTTVDGGSRQSAKCSSLGDRRA